MNWCAHLPRNLATLLHRYLDRDLSGYLDTLSDWPVMAHLLSDRSCYCGAVCAGDRYTHGDSHTVWHSYLARGLYRNFLALPLFMSLTLWGMLMVLMVQLIVPSSSILTYSWSHARCDRQSQVQHGTPGWSQPHKSHGIWEHVLHDHSNDHIRFGTALQH